MRLTSVVDTAGRSAVMVGGSELPAAAASHALYNPGFNGARPPHVQHHQAMFGRKHHAINNEKRAAAA